jgi:hypothetical protein
VEKEAVAIWCWRQLSLSSLAQCFVSIAAKESRKHRARDVSPDNVSLIPDERCFHFELDRALADDGLTGDQRLAAVRAAAERYCDEQRTIMRHCVLLLKGKQGE